MTDARLFRAGAEYQADMFRFLQSKTESYLTLQASTQPRAILDQGQGLYLSTDAATAKPWDEQLLGYFIADIRAAHPVLHLVLGVLHHSSVVKFARAGPPSRRWPPRPDTPCTRPQILAKYLPHDSMLALKAQRRRGLIGGVSGTGV